MTDPLVDKILFTGYRPEVAVEVIPMLARFFLHGFGHDNEFRRRLAQEVQDYLVELDNPRNGAICAWMNGKLAGAICIDASMLETQGARIRWFIVDEPYRKLGLGKQLFEKAMEFCKTREFARITIKTFKGRDPAVGLYARLGFTLCEERNFSTASTEIIEQWYEKVA